LISATDPSGKIIYCNDEFASISGYTREELVGSPHNLVRHPDMPPAVFGLMWSYLKSGKSWMGIVKNRCKNGDYYWVSAYVTPIVENGALTGYESVRVKPSREQIERAQKLYARLRTGKEAIAQYQYFRSDFVIHCFKSPQIFVKSRPLDPCCAANKQISTSRNNKFNATPES